MTSVRTLYKDRLLLQAIRCNLPVAPLGHVSSALLSLTLLCLCLSQTLAVAGLTTQMRLMADVSLTVVLLLACQNRILSSRAPRVVQRQH